MASECRVFQTKERSPCLIVVELYRPDELTLYKPEPKTNTSKIEQKSEKKADSFFSDSSMRLDDDESSPLRKIPTNA